MDNELIIRNHPDNANDRDPTGIYGCVEVRIADLEAARHRGDTALLWQLNEAHGDYLDLRHRWPDLVARYDKVMDCF